jgi:hypothetical protein
LAWAWAEFHETHMLHRPELTDGRIRADPGVAQQDHRG